MFKAQPLKHALPFSVTIFCLSIATVLLVPALRSFSTPSALAVALLGAISISALISGFFFWVGLGFSHKVPSTRKSVFFAAVSYFMAYNVLTLFGGSVLAQWVSFAVSIGVPLLLGVRWRDAWSTALPAALPKG